MQSPPQATSLEFVKNCHPVKARIKIQKFCIVRDSVNSLSSLSFDAKGLKFCTQTPQASTPSLT